MKFYKCSKNALKWSEMPQLSYKWNLPILVDTDLNVIAGNSLKDSLPDSIIVVMMDNYKREVLFQALNCIETKIAEENSVDRLNQINMKLTEFFREVRKPVVEYIELFRITENQCVTPENYIEPPPYNFNKHGKHKELFNEGCVLMEEFLEKIESGDLDVEVDLEILKELL